MKLVVVPDIFLPDGTVQRGEVSKVREVLRVNVLLARQLRAGIITIDEARRQMGL